MDLMKLYKIKKEFSVEKINSFLNKIDKKLETNTEILGNENKDILKSWINELNNTKEKTIKINIKKKIYDKNINIKKKKKKKKKKLRNKKVSDTKNHNIKNWK